MNPFGKNKETLVILDAAFSLLKIVKIEIHILLKGSRCKIVLEKNIISSLT